MESRISWPRRRPIQLVHGNWRQLTRITLRCGQGCQSKLMIACAFAPVNHVIYARQIELGQLAQAPREIPGVGGRPVGVCNGRQRFIMPPPINHSAEKITAACAEDETAAHHRGARTSALGALLTLKLRCSVDTDWIWIIALIVEPILVTVEYIV